VIKASENIAVVAWNIANDSYRTTLCLQYPAWKIAAAAIYLAGELTTDRVTSNTEWWEKLGTQKHEIEGKFKYSTIYI